MSVHREGTHSDSLTLLLIQNSTIESLDICCHKKKPASLDLLFVPD